MMGAAIDPMKTSHERPESPNPKVPMASNRLATPTQTQIAEIRAKSRATPHPAFFEKLSSRKPGRAAVPAELLGVVVFSVMATSYAPWMKGQGTSTKTPSSSQPRRDRQVLF